MPASDREMRGLWGHLLLDTLRRTPWTFWFSLKIYVPFLILMSKPKFLPFAPLVGVNVTWAGQLFALEQRRCYKMFETLPLSRRVRSRFLWFQFVALAPLTACLPMALLSLLALVDRTVALSLTSPLFLVSMTIAIASPAASALIWRREPIENASIPGLCVALTWIAWRLFSGESPLDVPMPWLLGTLALSALTIVTSFVFADRLVVGSALPLRQVAARSSLPASPRSQLISPLARMMLLEPLRPALVCVGFGYLLYFFTKPQGMLIAALIACLSTFQVFAAIPLIIQGRVYVIRQLPVSRLMFTGLLMYHSLASGLWTLFILSPITHGDSSILFNAVLLGACGGFFAPAFAVRTPHASSLFKFGGSFIVALTLLVLLFYGATSTLIFLPAVPACMIMATLLLYREILHESAFKLQPAANIWRGV